MPGVLFLPTREKVSVCVEAIRDLAASGVTMPWSGFVYVRCAGSSKVDYDAFAVIHMIRCLINSSHATGYASQHICFLSQARIKWRVVAGRVSGMKMGG